MADTGGWSSGTWGQSGWGASVYNREFASDSTVSSSDTGGFDYQRSVELVASTSTDMYAAGSLRSNVSAQAVGSDSVSCVARWELINTGITATWQVINTN